MITSRSQLWLTSNFNMSNLKTETVCDPIFELWSFNFKVGHTNMRVCGDWFTFRVEVFGSSCSFVPLVPTEHHVNPTAYRSIAADVFYVTGQHLQFSFTHRSFLWHQQFFIINIGTSCIMIKYVQATEAQEVCEADIQDFITQPLTFTHKSKKRPPSTLYLDKTVVGKGEFADLVSVIIVQWLMTQSVINEPQMKALCRPLVA